MRSPAELIFPIILFLIFLAPFLGTEQHDHVTKPLLYPNGLDTAYVEICGDSALVVGDYHRPLRDHTREWILDEIIIDKPF